MRRSEPNEADVLVYVRRFDSPWSETAAAQRSSGYVQQDIVRSHSRVSLFFIGTAVDERDVTEIDALIPNILASDEGDAV
jgi:hypothetical protein